MTLVFALRFVCYFFSIGEKLSRFPFVGCIITTMYDAVSKPGFIICWPLQHWIKEPFQMKCWLMERIDYTLWNVFWRRAFRWLHSVFCLRSIFIKLVHPNLSALQINKICQKTLVHDLNQFHLILHFYLNFFCRIKWVFRMKGF